MFDREESSADCYNQEKNDRISCKRKLDDYDHGVNSDVNDEQEEEFSDHIINTVRMKKNDDHEGGLIKTLVETRVLESVGESSNIHFFVRMMSVGKTIVIHAKSDDTVESVHEQIHMITRIPVVVQRLVYRGKQLQLEQTLDECLIENDSGLQLVGRMRSTDFPQTWRAIDDLMSTINRLCGGEVVESSNYFLYRIKQFLKMTPNDCGVKLSPKDNCVRSLNHLQIFKSSGASFALVRLFLSGVNDNRYFGEESIRLIISQNNDYIPKHLHDHCALIVLDFCKLLSGTARHEPLYLSCRRSLGLFLETIDVDQTLRYFNYTKRTEVIEDFVPFLCESAYRVSGGLSTIMSPFMCNEFSKVATILDGDVREFTAFSRHLCKAIEDHLHQKVPLCATHPFNVGNVGNFHRIFLRLVSEVDLCLQKIEETLRLMGVGELHNRSHGWTHYLSLLKELHGISRLYEGANERISYVMRSKRHALNILIRCLDRTDDCEWLFQYKDLMIFETRRHLVMSMFPNLKEDYEVLLEMVIDRSRLLKDSFQYIANADPEALRSGIFMEFKNENATGPGVLREWFFLVSQGIFNSQNALFLTCPCDHRRFFPNPASKVHPLHLEYFGFCGRIVALALMHKVQIGIAFDRVFFLQLAGELVTLEDVRDADPCFYMSCKQILEMDPDFLDTDSLGLTFVWEVKELEGPRRIVELCPGGNDIAVNSKNRECYVDLLIQYCFVTSVSEQVACFSRGFTDVLRSWKYQKLFFQSLDLKDLDRILLGCDRAISIRDWKTHTDYCGYNEYDHQIVWFWKVVETMSAEQQRVLLFFWTSVKYLPQEGFAGLSSRLFIYRTNSWDRLPSAHTCFYRLSLPPYPSFTEMKQRLHLISQEKLSCSFGLG